MSDFVIEKIKKNMDLAYKSEQFKILKEKKLDSLKVSFGLFWRK